MGIVDWFNTLHMDYDGQARAEKLSRIIILLFGVAFLASGPVVFHLLFVGFVWGYIIQQFSETVRILGAGFILAAILTIPPWPIYRRKPLNWQKVRPLRSGESEAQETKEKKKKK